MIQSGRVRIVQDLSELPDLRNARRLYADAETTNPSDPEGKKAGLYPYLGARACGWAITADDLGHAWYVPIRHTDSRWNLPLEPTLRWLRDVLGSCDEWVNANVKFDAHIAAQDGIEFGGRLVCVQNLAKTIDSDRHTYELESLSKDWLGMEMGHYHRLKRWLDDAGTKNYARVPADLLGQYACDDVFAARGLLKHAEEKRPAHMGPLWETEILLTPVLFDMERKGLRVDLQACKVEEYRSLKVMNSAADRIKELTGVELVDSSQCMYEILCVQLDLPVLAYTEQTDKGGGGNPSFDQDAMDLYEGHPRVVSDERAKEVVDLIRKFKKESTFRSLYAANLPELVDEHGILHPSYNQLVRTGRMSCQHPNSQQMSKRSKSLIVPRDGMAFLSSDASQIEFRVIVHYCKDTAATRAYLEDPNTDFHELVLSMCEMEGRGPAKTLNFAIAFGAGKRKVMHQLMHDRAVMAAVMSIVDAKIAAGELQESARASTYGALCQRRATEIWSRYHETFPTMKPTADEAARTARLLGYVQNLYGRRRHLTRNASRLGWNTVVQGTAMDIIKDRMVALAPRYNRTMREHGMDLVADVHDELLQEGPRESVEDPTVQEEVAEILENPTRPLRVPIRWSSWYSAESWREAVADAKEGRAICRERKELTRG